MPKPIAASLKSSRIRPFVWPRRAVDSGARSPRISGSACKAAATRERDPAPGAGDPEESHRFLRQGGKSMRCQLIDVAKEEFSVQRLCKVLGVSPSGYFAWRRHPASPAPLQPGSCRPERSRSPACAGPCAAGVPSWPSRATPPPSPRPLGSLAPVPPSPPPRQDGSTKSCPKLTGNPHRVSARARQYQGLGVGVTPAPKADTVLGHAKTRGGGSVVARFVDGRQSPSAAMGSRPTRSSPLRGENGSRNDRRGNRHDPRPITFAYLA
jgi:hypothetical protein